MQQPQLLHLCCCCYTGTGNLTTHPFLPSSRHRLTPFIPTSTISISISHLDSSHKLIRGGVVIKAKRKENVWSLDNDLAAAAAEAEVDGKQQPRMRRRLRRRGKERGRTRTRTTRFKERGDGDGEEDSRVLVSGAMLMEIETVLQTRESVIKPSWDAFSTSLMGIWKGVGAVFSPVTAEMEPIGVGTKDENLYDCYTLSYVEKSYVGKFGSKVDRKTHWVLVNPFGEARKQKAADRVVSSDISLPSYESFDLKKSEVMEEDTISMEPGLAFFEDGSYSRGPVYIPVGEFDESSYFLSQTFKFEQCLVKGCHKRLRIVHTIEFNEGGSSIQIVRVAVYEEQLVEPADHPVGQGAALEQKPFSQRRRTQPSELTGSWKVFEVSATPIFTEEAEIDCEVPFVYLCTETMKKRTLPESSIFFGEEEMHDMQDVTVLWLPGGVTAYVDVDNDGILCIGVGWYSGEGFNLVMEREYGTDGKLREVTWKTEVKRRWDQPVAPL